MRKTVKVRNIVFGEGLPKLCVPVVGRTREEILSQCARAAASSADVVEWRIDWYDEVFTSVYFDTLAEVRRVLGDKPLLVTFRTAAEGGEKAVTSKAYCELLKRTAETGNADLLDAELMIGREVFIQILSSAHANGSYVIASNHDFHHTPDDEELEKRMLLMQDFGADIAKVAVMPESRQDVTRMLHLTCRMSEKLDIPVITMSMSGTGVASRLIGELSGSALTFGSLGKASAPGQPDAEELSRILRDIHSWS